MKENRSQLKLLLLQIREDPQVRQEEHQSFARYAEVNIGQIDILNVFDTSYFNHDVIDGYDALMVGGASEANVLEREKYPFLPASEQLLMHCVAERIPVFASCFGFQLAVLALGGDIVHDDINYEMGTIPISLHDEAMQDAVFAETPDGFLAVAVHQQKALSAPPGATELAYTDQCCHSFKVDDAPFWAFQFHPEVDLQILVERLTIYQAKYTKDAGHLDEVLNNARETPFSNALLKNFVDRVLLAG